MPCTLPPKNTVYRLQNCSVIAAGPALIIVLSWLAMVIADLFRRGMPVIENYYQAAVLAVVFVGYAVGWRKEALGGALAILGTIGFIALNAVMFPAMPNSQVVGFAVPGLFYLAAHYVDSRRALERE